MDARLRHHITNMLPNSTERGNSEELIEIHGKLRACKKLSLAETEWVEGAYPNPILTDSPAGRPTAGGKKTLESQKPFYFRKICPTTLRTIQESYHSEDNASLRNQSSKRSLGIKYK